MIFLNNASLLRYDQKYTICSTCNNFPLGNWASISGETSENDHNLIDSTLTHSFICRLTSSNVFSLKNPTLSDFTTTLASLKRQCRSDSFVFIYLSTHIVRVDGGSKETKKKETIKSPPSSQIKKKDASESPPKRENAYIAFHDSVWGKPAEVTASCFSLSAFIAFINSLPTMRRTVLLHCAHAPKAKQLFSGPKSIYPPENLFTRLARESNAAVIGSCVIGTRVDELIKHTPKELFPKNEEASQAANSSSGDNDKNSASSTKAFESMLSKYLIEWEVPPGIQIVGSAREFEYTQYIWLQRRRLLSQSDLRRRRLDGGEVRRIIFEWRCRLSRRYGVWLLPVAAL